MYVLLLLVFCAEKIHFRNMKKKTEPHFFPKIIMFTRTGTTFIIKNYISNLGIVSSVHFHKKK